MKILYLKNLMDNIFMKFKINYIYYICINPNKDHSYCFMSSVIIKFSPSEIC